MNETLPLTETDVTVALTEHLLKALSPGESCKVDSRSKHKRPCRCGCKKNANYDNTNIGKDKFKSPSLLGVTFHHPSSRNWISVN